MTIIIASTPGPRGEDGNTVWPTTGAPASSVGVDGDFANDVTDQVMYGPKASGAWPAGVSYKGGAGPQGIPGSAAKYVPGTSYVGLVATGAKIPTSVVAGAFQFNTRSPHTVRVATNQVGFEVSNFYANSTLENPCMADMAVYAQVEYNGTCYPLTFGGNATGTVKDWSSGATDLVTLPVTLPAGARIYSRFFITMSATTGAGIPVSGNGSIAADVADGECFEYAASGLTNRSGTPGTFTSTSAQYFFRPSAIFGPTTVRSVGIIGDSRDEGYGDTASGNMDVGQIARSVGPVRAYLNTAVYGETAAHFLANCAQRAYLLRKYCTDIYAGYPVNDLSAGTYATAVMQTLVQIRQLFPAHYYYQCIPVQESTSTNSWATAPANQTAPSWNAQRVWVANLMRAVRFNSPQNAPMFDAVFDVAAPVEYAQNDGLWKAPGYTTDGIHGTALAYAAIASAGVITVA